MIKVTKLITVDACKRIAVMLAGFALLLAYLEYAEKDCVPYILDTGVHHRTELSDGSVLYLRVDRCPKCKGENQ